MIFVNDGSTDNTETVALEYGKKLIDKGYDFIYLTQKNSGAAAAINAGLKIFTGEYLTWPDSDDFLHPHSVEKRVNFLRNNPRYGFVRSDGYVCDERNIYKPLRLLSNNKENKFKENLFDDLLLNKTYIACGCYLARTSAFLEVNPRREIFPSRGGQNYQMLLPLALYYACGFIQEPLFFYVIRRNSHSRQPKSEKDLLRRCEEHEKIIRSVIANFDIDMDFYDKLIREKYSRKKLSIAGRFKDKTLAKKCFTELTRNGTQKKSDFFYYLMACNSFYNFAIRALLRIRQFSQKIFSRCLT